MKIAYVIDSLASKGGAERILTDKMNFLATRFGYEVYVITCYQNPTEDTNVYVLSDKVKQIDLKIHYYGQYRYDYPFRLWVKSSIYRQMVRGLTDAVQRIDPDILVGLGYFNADAVIGIKCRAKKVIESHEARIFTMSNKGFSRSIFSKAFMRLYRKYYLRKVERHADAVVTLTKGDAREWVKAKRIEIIPNFTMMPIIHNACDSKRVIAVGRLEWQKGFDRLIESWGIVNSRHPDWRLDIFGSGALKNDLLHCIQSHGLEQKVIIRPFTENISKEYSNSSIFALSSHFEGFALVLLEAMQSGLPCVTFDCPFGPSDVVADGRNGYVVKDGDIKTFAEKLCSLIESDELRRQFSKASVERAQLFDAEHIMAQWKKLFEELSPQ